MSIARVATIVRNRVAQSQRRTVALQGGNLDLFDVRDSQVYGDHEIDPNTMPFDPDLICEHSPASCVRTRLLHCGECGEVL